MIVVLLDKLRQLLFAVLKIRGIFRPIRRSVRDFRPDNKAAFVAQAVYLIRLLIMRKTNAVGAEFEYQLDIFFVLLIGYRRTESLPFLMPAYAV